MLTGKHKLTTARTSEDLRFDFAILFFTRTFRDESDDDDSDSSSDSSTQLPRRGSLVGYYLAALHLG